MLEPHFRDCGCHATRSAQIVFWGTSVRDRAVAAVPSADVAKDHECRGAVLPAFANIRTMRFLAYRVEVELAHEMPQARVVRAAGRLDLEPRRLPLRERLDPVAAHDLVESVCHLELQWIQAADDRNGSRCKKRSALGSEM